MCKKVKGILSIVFVILFSFSVYGETFKNKATVSYKKFSGTKKQEVIDQAIHEACLKSVKIYVNSFGNAEYENYKKVKEKIANNLSDYVICTLIDGVQDKKAKTYSAVVKAKILTKEFGQLYYKPSNANVSTQLLVDGLLLDLKFAICFLPGKSLPPKKPNV